MGHQTTSNNQLRHAGIVFVDLHQLNVKTTSRQYKSATLNTRRQPHVNEEQNRRTTTRNIRFPSKWLNKLTSSLSKRGPGISQPGSLKPAASRLITSEKRAYTSIKSDEEWTSRARSPSNGTILHNSLNYEGIAVIELQFYPLSWQWQTACWLLSQTK